MMGSLLIRGMLVGILAGLLAFGVAKLLGEPQVERAIAFEKQLDTLRSLEGKAKADPTAMAMSKDTTMSKDMSMSNAEAAEPELVSRSTQSGLGLLTGVLVYGAAFGGVFALVFGLVYGRLGNTSPRATAALLAAAGFVAIYLVPILKYPASPPSVGLSETIGTRTLLYFVAIAISVAAVGLAVAVGRRLIGRMGIWNAVLTGGATFLLAVGLAHYFLPSANEVPDGFPATVLWNFRLASIAIQITLWTTLGLVFGAFAESVMSGKPQAAGPAY